MRKGTTDGDCARRVKALAKLLKAEEKGRRLALKLQANEYGRRLSELNNAHERAEKALTMTVSREMFEQFKENYEQRHRTVASVESMVALEAKVDLLIRQGDRTSGALTLVRFMGVAGVVALLLGLLRMAGVIT